MLKWENKNRPNMRSQPAGKSRKANCKKLKPSPRSSRSLITDIHAITYMNSTSDYNRLYSKVVNSTHNKTLNGLNKALNGLNKGERTLASK